MHCRHSLHNDNKCYDESDTGILFMNIPINSITCYTQQELEQRSKYSERLGAARSRVRNPGEEIFFLLQNFQPGCGIHPASYSWVRRFFPRLNRFGGVKLTTRLHLVPRLGMSGAYLYSLHMLSWHEQRQIIIHIA